MSVVRPVAAENPLKHQAFINPQTGALTDYGHRVLTRLWERTGGFDDELYIALTSSNLGAAQSLAASASAEALARALGDAAAQGRLDSIDRLAGQLEALERRFGALQGISTAALQPAPKTRVIVFDASDTYSVGPDVLSIDVFCIGGGGGGGQGATLANGYGGGGGGGGGFTFATMRADSLPASVAITVGAAGTGGTSPSNSTAGGTSSFGTLVYARGGNRGTAGTVGAAGVGGVVTPAYGNLFQGGPGTDGSQTTAADAVNDYQGAPGGGGGGGYNNGSGGAGGAGSWRTLSATGGGGAGGAAGADGAAGTSAGDSDVYFGPGYGGGGGGGALTGDGGNGAAGVVGGGGGGGGAVGTGGTIPGNGGDGGAGRVIVVEHL